MNLYENWELFCRNTDQLPECLEKEPLENLMRTLVRSRAEQVQLADRVQAGDKAALKEFIDSYVPFIYGRMRRREKTLQYHTACFFRCYEKIYEYVANHLFQDNLEYNTRHYVSWMIEDECSRYILEQQEALEEANLHLEKKVELDEKYNAYMDTHPYDRLFALKDGEKPSTEQELIIYLMDRLSEREIKVLLFRFGFFDEKPHTLDETAKYFGVKGERIRQIENKALRKLIRNYHPTKSRMRNDFLNDSCDS